MNGLREKFRNKKGFTLIEMLIVVAIIAILIAVSIPLVGQALEKARDATDQANERSAKAEATLILMEVADLPTGVDWKTTSDVTTAEMFYKAEDGSMVKDAASAVSKNGKGYGQCTGAASCYQSAAHETAAKANTEMVIKATLNKTAGTVTLAWVATSGG